MSDNIPYEIQLEIINRVPDVKSLVRLRSVSKPWKSYIDSSNFISGFGVRDTQPPRFLLRYKEPVDLPRVKYVSFTDDVTLPQRKLNFAPNVPLLVKELRYVTVIGSSCGLWCLLGVQGFNRPRIGMIVIWNPSIRKAVGVVVPNELNNIFGKKTYFGFGVCPSTYDPTIVGITRCFQGNFKRNYNVTWQVTIFTLSSKTWTMIPLPTSNMPRGSIRLSSSTPVAIDRFIFWVAYDDPSSYKSLILSFDLITHEFKEVNLPDSIANRDVSIFKLRESLVVSSTEVDERVYGVWMMGVEGGAMTSFTKLFAINTPDLFVKKVLGYTKSGEPIIETEKGAVDFTKIKVDFTKIKVYDPCSEHINDLRITGVKGSFFISPYTETLLLTDHLDGSIIRNNY